MKISESLKKGSGTVAAGKAPDTAILRPRAGTFVEVTSVKTITDSSTENPWMALQALQIQQARNITRPPTQNLLFHPRLPLRVDSNIPATQARHQATLPSFLRPPSQPPTFQSDAWSSSQVRGEDRQGSKGTVLSCQHMGVWEVKQDGQGRLPGGGDTQVTQTETSG